MSLRNAIQQYGAIAETLTHAFLSFAPVAAGPGEIETERTFQLVQSISDLVALRRDKYLQPGATNVEGLKFLLRVVKCFQLWGEMRSRNSRAFALRVEAIRIVLSMIILRNSGDRLPEIELDQIPSEVPDVYVGSRTGTRLRSLSKLLSPDSLSDTQFSDFLHAIVPLVYLSSSGGWKRGRWWSWFLAIFLESASIMALPESNEAEKRTRIRRLLIEALVRQPMFDIVLNKPGQAVSNLWNRIPLLRDFNYLEYVLYMHRNYFYYHQ